MARGERFQQLPEGLPDARLALLERLEMLQKPLMPDLVKLGIGELKSRLLPIRERKADDTQPVVAGVGHEALPRVGMAIGDRLSEYIVLPSTAAPRVRFGTAWNVTCFPPELAPNRTRNGSGVFAAWAVNSAS